MEGIARFEEEEQQRKLSEYVELQKRELTALKEVSVDVSGEEYIEGFKQPEETMETAATQETQTNPHLTEEEFESNEETEEVPISTEDSEQQQSII